MSKELKGRFKDVSRKLAALRDERLDIIRERIQQLVECHGSLRGAADAIKVDHAYLHRLGKGEMENPTQIVLKKMGLL